MISTIQPHVSFIAFECPTSLFSEVKEKVSELYTKVKNVISPNEIERPISLTPNFHALLSKPFEIGEGLLWGGFLALSAYLAVESCWDLYRITVENPASQSFFKIGMAVKNAFVNIVSTCSSAVYMVKWADLAEIISLGHYLPFVKNLCYGLSLVMNTVEIVADGCEIWNEKEAILHETSAPLIELHKKKLCHVLLKLASHVSMVAWGALGIAAVAGAAIMPIVSMVFLTIGCVAGVTALFYKMSIDDYEKRVIPQTSTSQQ